MPAKLAFVEIPPNEATDAPILARRADLRFRFDAQLPSTTRVTREHVRLNCVPVVNVFETTTEPICPSLERPVHTLKPAGVPPLHGETYSVTQVRARVAGRPGMVTIAAYSELEAAPLDALEDVFYVARANGEGTNGNEVRLSLGSPADAPPVPSIEFLSIAVRAANGALPNALRIGDVNVPTDASPEDIPFRNISAVTPYCAPARGDALRWRTLAMTTLSTLPLTHVAALRTLLHVLDLRPLGDAQAARAHAQRLAAILDVKVKRARAQTSSLLGGRSEENLVIGHDVTVTLSQTGFEGEGDTLVFGEVLARLLGHEAALGAFVRTTVEVAETGRVFRFPALHGDRTFAPMTLANVP